MSIAANVAHSYVPPAGAPAGWTPPTGAVISAVFWPLALFVAIEILARTAWPVGKRWVALRYLGLLPVALVAAVVSYRHLAGLLVFYREDQLTATIGPLAVDGLMVMATGALIAAGRRGRAEAVQEPVPAPVAVFDTESVKASTGTRTGTPRSTRTDSELIAALADVPREPDGTVPVRRAAAALKCGPDRARRLLAATGLLRAAPPLALASTTRLIREAA